MQTTDPVVRYTAAAILLAAFFSALAVSMHGYWMSSEYSPPPIIVAILTSGVFGAAGALGLHVGTNTTITGVNAGAAAATAAHNGVKEAA